MLYHSFWKVAGVLIGIVVVLALILFGLLFYAQLRQIKGQPVITTDTVNDAVTVNETISSLIPTTDQKSVSTSTTTNSSTTTSTYLPTVDDDPVIGANNAAVTIIAFEDFQCPFCKRAAPVMKSILQKYPDEVVYVYKDFPLETIHPQSKEAALAANCADEQDEFWAYHTLLFENQEDFTESSIFSTLAQKAGLDVIAFDACLSDQRHLPAVQQDQDEGLLAGVQSTPTYFVNGVKVEGLFSEDQWVEIIDSVLAVN